jgi:hypothetical protein
MTNRPARTAAALATALLVGGVAPAAIASAEASPGAAAVADHVAQDRGGRQWHLTAALGRGPWKVRFYTCNSVDPYGNITFRFRATTRRSTDHKYPRVSLEVVDGSGNSSTEFGLFPGDRTVVESEPYLNPTASAHLELHNQGKAKTLNFTIGQVLPC